MQTCAKCRGGNFDEFIKVQHLEDLGGIVVRLLGAVIVFRCPECGFSQIAIPDMQGLVKAAAMARALNPARMSGKEIRFMRRALDITQKKFAEQMEMDVATISRWENDCQGAGGFTEKTLRQNVCALLSRETGLPYDPANIVMMKLLPRTDGKKPLAPLVMERVKVIRENRSPFRGWTPAEAA